MALGENSVEKYYELSCVVTENYRATTALFSRPLGWYQHTNVIIFLTSVRADSNYQTKQRRQNEHPSSPIISFTACLTSFIFQQYNIGFNVEFR